MTDDEIDRAWRGEKPSQRIDQVSGDDLVQKVAPGSGGTLEQKVAQVKRSGRTVKRVPGVDWATAVAAIREGARAPWLTLALGSLPHDRIVTVRAGSLVVLAGPTGSGKSSLAAQLAAAHAEKWPAIYLSAELPIDELASRVVSIATGRSWVDVLRGRVADDDARPVAPHLRILARREASLAALGQALAAARAEDADAPILAAIDYVQMLAMGDDVRARVGEVMAAIDELARQYGAVVLVVSQTSRLAARELRGGQRIGADSTDSGAESASIERYATTTLAIGTMPGDGDDPHPAIHIGKGRFDGGDRVVPALYDGASGRWSVAGAPVPAAEVRAAAAEQVEAARERKRVAKREQATADADAAILVAAQQAQEPCTHEHLRAAAGLGRDRARDAIARLLAAGELVEAACAPRSSTPRVWARSRAAEVAND